MKYFRVMINISSVFCGEREKGEGRPASRAHRLRLAGCFHLSGGSDGESLLAAGMLFCC